MKTKLQRFGFSSEDLDGLVMDAASQAASRVNNEGLTSSPPFSLRESERGFPSN